MWHFVIEGSTEPEAIHFAAAAARWLEGRGYTVSLAMDPDAEPLFLPLPSVDQPGAIPVTFSSRSDSLNSGYHALVMGSTLRLRAGATMWEIPLVVSSRTFSSTARPSLDLPRLLLRCDHASSRRLRMSARVVAEIRRRGWPFELVAYGEITEELVRAVEPDERHEVVTAGELARLVGTTSGILETADRPEELSAAFALGRSLGVPTFVHRDAASEATTACITVQEWSADAFADAVISASGPVRIAVNEREIQDSFERFEKALRGS